MTTETQAMIGVDVGGTKVLAIVLVGGQVVDRVQVPTPIGGDEIVATLHVDAVRKAGGHSMITTRTELNRPDGAAVSTVTSMIVVRGPSEESA